MAMMTLPLAAASQGNQRSGINLGNLDRSARPADDFYQYACGGWIDRKSVV